MAGWISSEPHPSSQHASANRFRSRSSSVTGSISSQAATLYRILVGKGHAELDATAILKLFDQGDSV